DKKEDAGDDAGRPEDTIPRAGRRRPSPTIDLKAEEVDEDAAKAETDEPSGDSKAEENETTPEKDTGSSPKDTGAPPDTGELPDEPPQRTTPGDVRGFATHLAAGLVGGVIGVVGVGIGLDKLPFATLTGEARSNAETAASDALGARLAALETKVTTLGEAAQTTDSLPAESLTALEERVAGAEEGLVAIKGFPGAMTERVVRLEAALKTLGETAAAGGDVAQQAAFESQMNALEQRLEERVDAVEKSVAEARTDMPDGGDLAALRSDLEEVKSALTEISSGSGNGELQADVARRLADVEKQIAGLGSGTPQAGSGTGGAALAIGFAGLTGAIARGEPFLRELETLKTMAPAGLDLTSLEASAATGAPTLAELQQSFRVLGPTARDAARNRQSDNSLVGQLVSRARTIVRVERIDAGAAGGAAAMLSGMAEHLKSGDLNAVIAESEKLPDAVRAAMGSWLDQARTRLELDNSVKQLTARLAEILARSPAPKSGN
ncbi:MAG: hypothetical protein OEM91_01220, partial [Hyphomicrobiales bacterium]|nr:hypothetical protein [Hyphomicrobiales bacterium]